MSAGAGPVLTPTAGENCSVCRLVRASSEGRARRISSLEPTATFLSPQAFDTFCRTYIRGLIREVAGNPGVKGAAAAGDVAGGTDATGGRAGAGARTATGTTDAAAAGCAASAVSRWMDA
ncbi:MAG: hypothetical protein ACM3ZU_15790 [Bacteroidota bacterium]